MTPEESLPPAPTGRGREPPGGARRDERGAALLMAVIVSAALSILGGALTWFAVIAAQTSAAARDHAEVHAALRAGVEIAAAAVAGEPDLAAVRRGSLRGHLAWLGVLAYLVYTFLEFAVSPPFTALYLVYIAAFACAIPALAMAAHSLDLAAIVAATGTAHRVSA